ncbi:MAG: glycosyltransferase family 39 protein [Thermoflexales bacterium]|nr:glycosyltransferase family 39 protein [Thermoflexales bacterium]
MRQSPRLALAVILAARFALGVFFSLNVPLWEAFDETGHYAYARYIATHRQLPPLGTKLAPFDETHQPPLYYILVALPMILVPSDDELQPVFTAGGKTWVVPTPEDRFPWSGTALALRLGRLASLVMSMAGVVLVFEAVKLLTRRASRMALIAAFFYAFWPQHLFQSGTISNDVGMTVMGAASFWAIARALSRQHAQALDWALVGLLTGLSTWVKANGVAFVIAGLGVALVHSLSRRQWLAPAVLLLVTALVIGMGTVSFEARMVRRVEEVQLPSLSTESSPLASRLLAPLAERALSVILRGAWLSYTSFFAAYSWGTLQPPESWLVLAAVSGALVFLLGFAGMGRKELRLLLVLAGWICLCVAAAPIARAVSTDEPSLLSGRFFLPALAGVAAWSAVAFEVLRRLNGALSILATSLFSGLPFVSLLSPWLVLQPAYTIPTPLTLETVLERVEISTNLVFGDALRMLGYRTLTKRVEAGSAVAIEVFWQVLRPTERGYGVQLDVFNCRGDSMQVRHRQSLGNNTLPTWRLVPGMIFADTYRVQLHRGDYPALVYLSMNFFDQQTNAFLPWRVEGELPNTGNRIGNVPVSQQWTQRLSFWLQPALARLGNSIELVAVDLPRVLNRGESLIVQPTWRAHKQPTRAYTVFVHVLDAQGRLQAQHDQPPRQGCYPTSVWQVGDVVPDAVVVESNKLAFLPAGQYTVRLGMYDAESIERLPVFRGTRLVGDGLTFKLELR